MPTTPYCFQVSGDWRNYNAPGSGSGSPGDTNALDVEIISAMVDFIPKLPNGFVAYVDDFDLGGTEHRDTAITIAPLRARIWRGELSTLNRPATPGVELLSGSDALNLAAQGIPRGELIYNVVFSKVVYAEGNRAISSFSFLAPPDATPVVLTDPLLDRQPYQPWIAADAAKVDADTWYKTPTDIVWFQFNWIDWLPSGTTISFATITVPGLTLMAQKVDGPFVDFQVTGGVLNHRYSATCRMTTSDGSDLKAVKDIAVRNRIV